MSTGLKVLGLLCALAMPVPATSGAIFLTGHDPDFHSVSGNTGGAHSINDVAIDFILNPAFNPFVAGGVSKFLFVESNIAAPGGHIPGVSGITASGYVAGTDFEHHDAAMLGSELDLLGTKYAGIVVASDFGGLLTQAELDILNARSSDIISFLNDGGGIYAMAESNGGAHLTPGGGQFGFLPFVVSSTAFDQAESNVALTPFGLGLGLSTSDVNGNFSHNIFTSTGGLQVVDRDARGNILTLAGRGLIDPDTGIGGTVPLPATMPLLFAGVAALALLRRRRI